VRFADDGSGAVGILDTDEDRLRRARMLGVVTVTERRDGIFASVLCGFDSVVGIYSNTGVHQ
jgi:hypothetical protein